MGWSSFDRYWAGSGSSRLCAGPDVARALGEAANAKSLAAIKQSLESQPNVIKLELLTMHLAPKQILINAHVNLRNDLRTEDIVQTTEEIEELIKRAEPKVEMIFLEIARQSQSSESELVPEHIG